MRGIFKSPSVVKCLTTFVEWYFYASSPVQTEKTLADQDMLLSQFNELKEQFAEISLSSLNFEKFHSLQHISESTRTFGTPDNADTEITEHQHRMEVKIPYRRMNKRDPLFQVVKFVEHQTALEDKLNHITTSKFVDTSSSPPVTEKYWHLSASIPEGVLHINEVSKLFELHDLEFATQTFFHDLQFASRNGYHHRVNRKNLPKLSNPTVSYLCQVSL